MTVKGSGKKAYRRMVYLLSKEFELLCISWVSADICVII